MARMLLAQPCSTAVVGPTGVWHHASQIDLHQRGFRYEYDRHFAHALVGFLLRERATSLFDAGAGVGTYLSSVRVFGIAVAGVDGSSVAASSADGLVQLGDLTDFTESSRDELIFKPSARADVADWVLSLEVGEHIPRSLEPRFVYALHRLNRHGIVLSWSCRGDREVGTGHVNPRENSEVVDIFSRLGYVLDRRETARLRNASGRAGECCHYFRETLLVLRRTQPASEVPSVDVADATVLATRKACFPLGRDQMQKCCADPSAGCFNFAYRRDDCC